jgi:hypothetical protein
MKQGGRWGSWFTYNDNSDGGMQWPVMGGACLPSLIPGGGRCGDLHGMNTYGWGFTGYGAGIGFDLNHPDSMARAPYDAHMFNGIVFFGLGPAADAGGTQTVKVQFLTSATTPISAGGTCPTTATCNDHYYWTATLPGTGWVPIKVDWSDSTNFRQDNWGTQVAWDPKTLLAIQFYVNPANSFNFWVDDISFY